MTPLTVSMTPAFLYDRDWLFRAQLRCLSEQENKDFDVLVIDPHYSKRKAYMSELAEKYALNIVHVPYAPAQHIAKKLDCAVFNAAYCYSESPRIVRYSCWRFVRPNFTDLCLNSKTNVDFYFHSIEPANINGYNPLTNHNSDIWDFGSDEVHWGKVPRSGQKGATWTHHSEVDAPAALFPLNAYGNYMVFRDEWLNVNGCNEAFNTTHFEDMDFTIRAANNGMTCERKALVMYRLHHYYGNHSGRANIPTDYPATKCCAQCEKASQITEPNRYALKHRLEAGEIDIVGHIWVCKTCYLSGAVYHADCGEYTNWLKEDSIVQAPILPEYKIGRNLRVLAADMDGKSLTEKFDLYTKSWTDERYYTI